MDDILPNKTPYRYNCMCVCARVYQSQDRKILIYLYSKFKSRPLINKKLTIVVGKPMYFDDLVSEMKRIKKSPVISNFCDFFEECCSFF